MSISLPVLGVPGVLGGGGSFLPSKNLLFLWNATTGAYADAALTTKSVDGGIIRGSKDESGNAIDISQSGDSAICPTWRQTVSQFNNRSAFEFDGGDYLFNSIVSPLLGDKNVYTLYIVLRWTSTDTSMVPVTEGNSASANSYIMLKPNDSGAGKCRPYHIDADGDFTSNLQSSSQNNNDGLARLVVMRRLSATEWESWINGWQEKAQTIANVGDASTNQITLGALGINGSFTQHFTGQVALVAGYSADNYSAVEPLIDAYFDVTESYWIDPVSTVLCIGDSKTGCTNDPTRDYQGGFGWPPILSANLATTTGDKWRETKKQRIGISGYTVAQMASVITAQLAAITSTPNIVLISLGTNDLVSLPAEATWKANYRTIIAAVNTAYPSAKIYLSKPVRLAASPPSAPVGDTATMHGWIDDLVAEQSYIYLGADETALEGGDGYVTNFEDALHPNHTGYIALAGLLQTALGY